MKKKKSLAVILTLVVVAALLPASFSAVSASNDDFYDDDPTGHCIETLPGMLQIISREVDYDSDFEDGWMEFYAPEDMEVVGMEFLLCECFSDSLDTFTVTDINSFTPDMELRSDAAYNYELEGRMYKPEAPVSLKKGDCLLHLEFSPFEGFFEFKFDMWNLVVRTPDGNLVKYENGIAHEKGGAPLLRGDVLRDLKVDINDATELQKALAEFGNVHFLTSTTEPSVIDLCMADMDGDKKITVRDVTALQSTLAEFIV